MFIRDIQHPVCLWRGGGGPSRLFESIQAERIIKKQLPVYREGDFIFLGEFPLKKYALDVSRFPGLCKNRRRPYHSAPSVFPLYFISLSSGSACVFSGSACASSGLCSNTADVSSGFCSGSAFGGSIFWEIICTFFAGASISAGRVDA